MHSNIDGKDCKEIRLTIINNDYEEPLSNTLYDIKVPDYQWRQLVPMQDFRDINVANATCTNLNFLLLHKDAIESLINIENFIRDIADVSTLVFYTNFNTLNLYLLHYNSDQILKIITGYK